MKARNDIFLDSNIVLYLHDEGVKYEIAKELITLRPLINAQVIAEYANVCLRKFKFTKPVLATLVQKLISETEVLAVNSDIYSKACDMMLKYDFQFFDAIIVASALEANCRILYSEDLQHRQIIESSLTIINPFI
jgi:predicted nucleic acid-binding protein